MRANSRVKVTVEIEVEVDPEWIDFVTQWSDLFQRNYCGYWAHGVDRDADRGWLAYVGEDGEGEAPDDAARVAATQAWMDGADLPAGFYRWDTDMATRAYAAGVKRNGADWYDKADAWGYDAAIQEALFGEVRFA